MHSVHHKCSLHADIYSNLYSHKIVFLAKFSLFMRFLHIDLCITSYVGAFLQVLQRLIGSLGNDHFQVLVLQVELQLAKQDYQAALIRFVD